MKILVVSNNEELLSTIEEVLERSGVSAQLLLTKTVDEFVTQLKSDAHDFIITEYWMDEVDIWRMAKLVNSSQLAAHALPLFLVNDTCDNEIPMVLAAEHHFESVTLAALPDALTSAWALNQRVGYVRGARPPAKSKVLIIEDDEDAAFFISEALKSYFEVDKTDTGEEGLELWKEQRHDLVLLDYMLPGIKGDIVLNKIMDIDKDQPVVVMTAFDRPEYNQRMILNGASEYLNKPFDLSVLKPLCQRLVDRSKLTRQAHYSESRDQALKDLIWALGDSINQNEHIKAKRIANKIKSIFPDTLSDDEQISLLNLEF